MYENVITYTPRVYSPKSPRGAGQLNKWSQNREHHKLRLLLLLLLLWVLLLLLLGQQQHPHVCTTGCRLQRQHPTQSHTHTHKHTQQHLLYSHALQMLLENVAEITARTQCCQLELLSAVLTTAAGGEVESSIAASTTTTTTTTLVASVCPWAFVAASEGHFPACRVHCAHVKINKVFPSVQRVRGDGRKGSPRRHTNN